MSDADRGAALAAVKLVSLRMRRAEKSGEVPPDAHPLAALVALEAEGAERVEEALASLSATLPELIAEHRVPIAPDDAAGIAEALVAPWRVRPRMLLRTAWHRITVALALEDDGADWLVRLDALERAAAEAMRRRGD